MGRALREPLLHFLLAGAGLFLAFEWIGGGEGAPDDQILVDQGALVQFMMHRDPRLSVGAATAALENMTPGQRDNLIEQFVREEVLFRQASELGLDQYDYVGRRRLINQLDYINRGFIEEGLAFSDDELRAFHQANRGRYFVPAKVTFTHVYFSGERRGEQARSVAADKLAELNEGDAPFHLGAAQGDRFPYHRNYVGKDLEEVTSHFGAGFAEAVFQLPAAERWVGPIASEFGYHLVMVTSQKASRVPPFEEVLSQVVSDLAAERVRAELESYYQQARAGYNIVVALPEAAS